MDNLLSPAYPLVASLDEKDNKYFTVADMDMEGTGFSKLELASLMIAQGMCSEGMPADLSHTNNEAIASAAVLLAKAVLTEANK